MLISTLCLALQRRPLCYLHRTILQPLLIRRCLASWMRQFSCSFRSSLWLLPVAGVCLRSSNLLGRTAALFLKVADCKGRKRRHLLEKNDFPAKNLSAEAPIPWRQVFDLLLPDVLFLIGAVVSAVLVAIINIQIPLLLGDLVNVLAAVRSSGNLSPLNSIALKLMGFYSLQAFLTFVYISLLSVMGENVAARLRLRLFESLLKQDIAFFDAHRSGEIIGRLGIDVQEFKSALKQVISQGLRSSAQTIGCVISLYLISPKMTAVTVSVVPAIVILGTLLGSGLRLLSRKAQLQTGESLAVADEALSNVRTVRAFAMERTELDLFKSEVDRARSLNEYLGVGIGAFQGLANFALNGIVVAVLSGGGYLIVRSEVSPGDLMSFLVTSQTIQRSLAQVSLLFGQGVKGLSAISRVFEYLNINPKISLTGGRILSDDQIEGRICFENVTFAYPTRQRHYVLRQFSLELPRGTITALCGMSGEGKSTVAALLERFYDVNNGKITLDGIDLRELDPTWLRGRVIGYVSQEPVLFHTTIKENIRYGKPTATDAEIFEAAGQANAAQFIENFPRGYETVVGERGVTLSGGQKQRIALARAFLKNPKVLILDEATSALDSESEKQVQNALENLSKGRTVLVIAHRLSTIQNADNIAVIAHKKVAEIGSHSLLMRKRGLYYQLVFNQMQP